MSAVVRTGHKICAGRTGKNAPFPRRVRGTRYMAPVLDDTNKQTHARTLNVHMTSCPQAPSERDAVLIDHWWRSFVMSVKVCVHVCGVAQLGP